MLVQNPLAGRERVELAQGLRSFSIGNYTVFYTPMVDGIDVVRVINSRQDIDADDMA